MFRIEQTLMLKKTLNLLKEIETKVTAFYSKIPTECQNLSFSYTKINIHH